MPQKRYIVNISCYVFADDESDLDRQGMELTDMIEDKIDGSNATVDKKMTAGFAEMINSRL